jgi:hypothetical protein
MVFVAGIFPNTHIVASIEREFGIRELLVSPNYYKAILERIHGNTSTVPLYHFPQ